ncbi:hypothetical protein K8O92_31320 [Nocardia asteroides]|nr:hypothetical protein K8O92_31320 [Nocardia asteroides]
MSTDKFRGPPVTSTNGGNPAAGRYVIEPGNRPGRLRSIALPASLVNSATALAIPRPPAVTVPRPHFREFADPRGGAGLPSPARLAMVAAGVHLALITLVV